jgi:tetratricopeptide (TPR) repeat protein
VRKVLLTNRPISLLSALFLGFCLIPVSLLSQTQGQKADDASGFSIAVQAYRDGLLDLARDQLEIYLAAYPHGKHVAEAHYLLGDYFFRKGNFVQVVQHVREALQRQLPAVLHDDAYYLLGRSSLETGQYAEAREAFQPLTAPGHSGRWHEAALYWSGQALLSLGDFASAAPQLQQLIDSYPNSEYLESGLYGLGYAWQKAGAHEQGLETFQLFLQRFPQSPLHRAAEYGVARALMMLQRFAEAAPHWERISEAEPSPTEAEEATFWWAESWTRAERCDQAIPVFQVYLRRFPLGRYGADALAAIAMCAHTIGEFATEIAAREAFLQEFPADARRDPMLLHLAEAYEQSAQPSHAREIYSQWLLMFPGHAHRSDVLIRRGLISQAQEDDPQVIEDFAEVLRQTSDPRQRALAHAVLAQIYARLDDCTAALPHLSAVIEQGNQPAQQHARWQRGLCAYRNKAFAAAVEDFDQLFDDASFAGDRQSLLLLSGQSLAALNRDQEAVDRFRRFLAVGPTDKAAVQALAGLGASLLKVGEVEAALPVYEQLLIVAPELPAKEQLHLQLGLRYLERQAVEHAKRHFEAAANGHDAAVAAEATYRLADRLFAEGMEAEATALLHKLTTQLVSQPAWVGIASYRLALLYEAKELWPEAWQAYMIAAKTATDPQLVQAARERAQHLEETVDVHARQEPASSQAERNL